MVCNLRHANTALFTSAGEEKMRSHSKQHVNGVYQNNLHELQKKKTVMNHVNILFSRLTDNKLRN